MFPQRIAPRDLRLRDADAIGSCGFWLGLGRLLRLSGRRHHRQNRSGNDRVTLDIVLLKDNDKIRIWSSLFPDGTALVEDGVMTSATGRETRWMTRCP